MKLNTIYILQLIFVCLFELTAHAQYPVMRQLTTDDGLPGNLVYTSMQDSKGYIWSSTDRGVSRFDGNQFELFTIKDGLPSNDVWHIMEDHKGRLWMSTFNGVCYFENGKIKRFEHKQLPKNPEMVQHYKNALGHFIIVQDNHRSLFFLNEEDSLISLKKNFFYLKSDICIQENKKTAKVFKNFRSKLNRSIGDSVLVFNSAFISDTNRALTRQLRDIIEHQLINGFISISPNKIIILISGELWTTNQNRLERLTIPTQFQEKQEFERIKRIASNRIWIKTKERDYIVDSLWNKISEFDFLKNISINDIFFDAQKNVWLSTRFGLYFLNKKAQSSRTYFIDNKKTDNINFLTLNQQQRLWCMGTEGYLYRLEEESLKLVSESPIGQSPTDLEFDIFGNLWLGYQFLKVIPHEVINQNNPRVNFSQHAPIQSSRNRAIKKILPTSDKNLIVATYNGINTLTHPGFQTTRFFKGRFYGITGLKNGNYWISGKTGLKLISNKGELIDFEALENNLLFDMPINNIALEKDEKLWFAVNNKGVYLYDSEKIDSIKELKDLLIQALYVDDQNRLWASSNQGLAKISNIQSDPFKYNFQWYTEANGLASNDVKETIVKEGHIYIATRKGLTILNDNQIAIEGFKPPVYFSKIWINGEEVPVRKKYDLNYNQNNLKIDYQCLDYQSMGSMTFEYQLEGAEEDWATTTKFEKEYPLLPSGKYTFRLRKKGIASSPVLEIYFNIKPPLWKRTWFTFTGIFLMGIVTYSFFQRKINRVKARAREENLLNKKFAELELNALQSQMNPHFIFNALHAIQDFIFKRDPRVANKYIVKFSRLMRLFLESSKEKYILLQDEIQLLRLYIELEKLRFDDKFDFEIKVADQRALSMIEIPSMLLQPFVENAINHGLIHLKGSGNLSLQFIKEKNQLHCRIQDNGIGRKKAMEIKSKSINSYKSRGMQLIEERRKLWNQMDNTRVEIFIKDLFTQDGDSAGTQIDIIIDLED